MFARYPDLHFYPVLYGTDNKTVLTRQMIRDSLDCTAIKIYFYSITRFHIFYYSALSRIVDRDGARLVELLVAVSHSTSKESTDERQDRMEKKTNAMRMSVVEETKGTKGRHGDEGARAANGRRKESRASKSGSRPVVVVQSIDTRDV